MEEQAMERTDTRSILNSGFGIDPVEKRLDRLTVVADTKVKTIAGTQRIIRLPFPRHDDVDVPLRLEESGPSSICIGTVSK